MIADGREIPAGTALEAEVAIVGAGPAGLSIAADLSARGVDVLILEAGERTHTKAAEDGLRGEGVGEPTELVRSRRRGFAGTSIHWQDDIGVRLRRMDPLDLDARPVRGGIGWPIGADELERWYVRAFEAFGLDPDVDPAHWFEDGLPTPLAWPGGPELAMFRMAEHDWFVNQYDQFHANPRVRILLHSAVTEIGCAADDPRRVEQLSVATTSGSRFRVRARHVVLATGGIDNARLLLASPGATGAGIGNENDQVGRWFQDHLAVDSGLLVPAPGVDLRPEIFGFPRDTPVSRFQGQLWLGDQVIREHDLLNAVAWVRPVRPAYLATGVGALRRVRQGLHTSPRRPVRAPLGQAVRDASGVVRFGADRLARRGAGDEVLLVRYFTEQVPNRDSRVTLSEERDGFGLRRAKVDWRVAEGDLALIRQHQDLLSAALEEHGVARLERRYDGPGTQIGPVMPMYHHMGTTRMHPDPRQGVVDVSARVHSTHNLHVAGSSVFPTGSYVNPTLTLLALAHRLADELCRQLGR